MSAFVVGADCISRVIDGLRLAEIPCERYKITAGNRARKFATFNDAKAAANAIFDKTGVVVGIEAAESDTEFGRRLLAMNIDAVRQRYGTAEVRSKAAMLRAYSYAEPAPLADCTPAIAAWKALQCFLYQCSEGNIPEMPLFQLVESYAAKLGARILERRNGNGKSYKEVWDMPECASAPWGD
jgi:hypothetical protein